MKVHHIFRGFISWIKKNRIRLARRKEVISTVLIILATISLTLNAAAQSQKSEEETNLIFQISNVGVSYGSYAANTAEIILDRSIAAGCGTDSKGDQVIDGACGSSDVLLQEAAAQRNPLRTNNTDWVNTTTATFQKFSADAPSLNEQITVTETAAVLLLVLAIIANTL